MNLCLGRAVLALASVAGLSCATLQRVRFVEPSVQLQGVAVTGLGFEGGSLRLQLDVYNPNGYELRSTRLQATIDLESTPFGEAIVERPLVLPARSHINVEIPLSFRWAGVGAGARALLGKGSVRYGLVGRILVDTPIGERSAALRTDGTVAVTDLVR